MNILRSTASNERGAVLVVALAFLAILSMLGSAAYLVTTTDLQIASNYRDSKSAFYQADAGVQYGLATMENAIAAGTFVLPEGGTSQDVQQYTEDFNALFAAGPPSGFNFVLTPVTVEDPAGKTVVYTFGSQGSGAAGAVAKIEAVFKKDVAYAINYAAFGDLQLDFKANGAVYSYDSDVTSNPTPAGSTSEGDIGSNGSILLYNGTIVDGSIALGADAGGTDATMVQHGNPGPIVSGENGVAVGRVTPDPLGAIGGPLEADFDNARINNANGSIVISAADTGTPEFAIAMARFNILPAGGNGGGGGGGGGGASFTGTDLSLGNGDVVTLTGPGDYYFTSIDLKNGSALNIDATAGPVNIYLEGPLDAKNGSMINITGDPTDFTLFSNSTDSIVFKHGSDFNGLVYAPYAAVEMKNSADVRGAVWANTFDIKNSGELFFDIQLRNKFMTDSGRLVVTAWKELREGL